MDLKGFNTHPKEIQEYTARQAWDSYAFVILSGRGEAKQITLPKRNIGELGSKVIDYFISRGSSLVRIPEMNITTLHAFWNWVYFRNFQDIELDHSDCPGSEAITLYFLGDILECSTFMDEIMKLILRLAEEKGFPTTRHIELIYNRSHTELPLKKLVLDIASQRGIAESLDKRTAHLPREFLSDFFEKSSAGEFRSELFQGPWLKLCNYAASAPSSSSSSENKSKAWSALPLGFRPRQPNCQDVKRDFDTEVV